MASAQIQKTLFAALAGVLAVSAARAQDQPLPANYIRVSAPYAQKIVVAEMEKHSNQIQKIGLHAVPPGATDNVIIASEIPSKIGKKSSASDLEILAAGKPHALRVDKGKFFDLSLPITDAKGRSLNGGFLVMEVPFADASNAREALKIGSAIRNELQQQIPSKKALYR